MVNSNIQSPVPLAGKGHSLAPKHHFEPGEYKYLVNAEINEDGHLINRRPFFNSDMGGGATVTSVSNPQRIIGENKDFVVVASKTAQYAYNVKRSSNNVAMWAPTNLPIPAGGYHNIVGYFIYGGKSYWITQKYDPAGPTTTYYIYTVASTAIGVAFGSLTVTTVGAYSGVNEFKTFFINGDRLWLVFDDNVLFSKATDPTVWAAPDGGFFKFPGDRIQYGMAIRNGVYILCDENIYLIDYTADPNTDAYVRKILDRGAKHGCIYDDSPYFIDNSSVFTLSGSGVDVIVPFYNNSYGTNTYYKVKLVAFRNYIVMVQRKISSYDNNVAEANPAYYFDTYWDQDDNTYTQAVTSPFNCHFINMNNGSVHAVYMEDGYNSVQANRGLIADVYVNETLCVLTSAHVSGSFGGNNEVRRGQMYLMFPEQYNAHPWDVVYHTDGTPSIMFEKIAAELEGFCPDGNEYQMKKFRNLLVTGHMSQNPFFNVGWSFNRKRAYVTAKQRTLEYNAYNDFNTYGNDIREKPWRFGINQRGRNINIKFMTEPAAANLVVTYATLSQPSYQDDHILITDVRLLWTWLGRHVGNTSITVPTGT